MERSGAQRQQKAEGSRRKVLLVKDSSAQTTPPNSPAGRGHARNRSKLEVTPGSKVNGPATPEFRTVVNVFDDRRRPDSSEMVGVYTDRAAVVIDTDSIQSTVAPATDNGPRVYTDKLRRTNGLNQTAPIPSYKGSFRCCFTLCGSSHSKSVSVIK